MIRLFAILMLAGSVGATDIRPANWRIDYNGPGIRYSGLRSTNSWTVYTNLPASTTVAGFNAAVVNCPAGQMIRLTNGTFTVDARWLILRDNIRIEGGGPTNTILNVTGASSSGIIEVGGNVSFPPTRVRNWTAGYANGVTTITVASAANIDVGDVLILTQTSPGTRDINGAGDEGDCVDCSGAIQDVAKTQQFHCRVTSISGTDIGIDKPLYMTNWASGFSPQCYNYDDSTTNVVIANLQIDNSASALGSYGIFFQNFYDVWVDRVWIKRSANRHITTLHGGQIEVTDSYFTDSKDWATHSYGFAPYNCTGFWCVNNIFQGVTGAFKPTSASVGVFAFNYVTNVLYTPDANWNQATIGNHGSHSYGILIEGNIGPGCRMDDVHGSSSHNVIFRNRFIGPESNRTDNAFAVALQATNRYTIIAGNVLGKQGFHTSWRLTYNASGSSSTKAVEEYGYVDVDYRTTDGDNEVFNSLIATHNQLPTDIITTNGAVYWGNGYDGTLVLEKSYLYPEIKPSWWGCSNFPGIGPGLVYSYCPAKQRYESGDYFTALVDTCSGQGKKAIRGIRTK